MARRALITGITGQDGSYLAELLLDKGDTARALELAQKAAELAPQNPQIQFNLAKAGADYVSVCIRNMK